MTGLNLRLLLDKYNNIYIFTHLRPDGDAIGSSLALGNALRHESKNVRLFCSDEIPSKYSFLPGVEVFQDYFELEEEEGLAFVLDCSDLKRLAHLKDGLKELNMVINIDHHITNEKFGDINIIDSSAASTGEIIYKLLQTNNLEINKEISLCLYVAISSDTGSFKYENTMPKTMEIAGKLLENGVNPSYVSQIIFDEYPLSTISILSYLLSTLQLDETGKIAWMQLTEKVLREYGAKPDQLDGFVNYAKNIIGVEVGVFFYHTEDGETKTGLRSKSVDVAAIAHKFGGGGHIRAAGCSISGKPDDVVKMVLEAIKNGLNEKVV
ncbi:MAG: bifunctional oligoribonuclease/PAP phosphatase NrnA [Bacillota bacterium]|nr:bifunctional oligoribonuclease/PAP phosphatase NrnA [Bacillota bacterium]